MAKLRKTSGGMVEIVKSRPERVRNLSLGIIPDMGEVLDYLKGVEERLSKLEGKKKVKTFTFSMEKKLTKIKKLRGGK